MRIRNWIPVIAVFVLACGPAFPATITGTGVRDSASFGTVEKWSVGLSGDWIRRDLKASDGGAILELEARTLEFFAGYDPREWFTIFATLGGTAARSKEYDSYGEEDVKISIGIQGNLWQTDIVDPEFMTGVLTFKSVAEISNYRVDNGDGNLAGRWTEYSLAFPFCYEIFADRPDNKAKVPYSLVLSLGPGIGVVDGNLRATSGGARRHYREDKVLGLFGGVDIYFSHNLSVGCQVEYFNDASVGGSVIYHF